jgi:hypothetical protein
MNKILDWRDSATIQKEPKSGCIPTGYEFLIKMGRIENVVHNTFQDDFDLNKRFNDSSAANFRSVAEEIKRVYPFINIEIESFDKKEGQKKVAKIKELIEKDEPVLISLNINEFTGKMGWHIMPVIGISDNRFRLLKSYVDFGKPNLIWITFSNIIKIHENYPGGEDIAYLAKLS